MSLRAIAPLAMPDVAPAGLPEARPAFDWVDPRSLVIEDRYQRDLSQRSVALIRRIVANWDWRRFKPPIVARTANGLEVIDGQHTSIAAASHPSLTLIPVMIVSADDVAARASAFLGHNRDRLNVTGLQIHAAAVAAGDPYALTVEQVCERAGVTVLRYPPGNGLYKPRTTLAVSVIRSLAVRRGAMKARQVLEVLAQAECAPIGATEIKAVEALLFGTDYAGEVAAADLVTVIRAQSGEAERDAKVFSAAHGVPLWKALAITWFKRCRHGRRRAA